MNVNVIVRAVFFEINFYGVAHNANEIWFIFGTTQTAFQMLIERTDNDKIQITVSSAIGSFGLQRLIDYIRYLEATAKSKAKQTDVDKLADEVNASWWAKNSKRFIK